MHALLDLGLQVSLQPSTTYYYTMSGDVSSKSKEYSFTTLAAAGSCVARRQGAASC